jgi:hypothetical protein
VKNKDHQLLERNHFLHWQGPFLLDWVGVVPSRGSSTSSLICVLKSESASRPLVNFDVLNDNLIKGLISCVK